MQKNVWTKADRRPNNATCVEVLDTGHNIWVRDSKTSSVLRFSYEEWEHFTIGVRRGEFDQKEEK
jgi:hypothetical protein